MGCFERPLTDLCEAGRYAYVILVWLAILACLATGSLAILWAHAIREGFKGDTVTEIIWDEIAHPVAYGVMLCYRCGQRFQNGDRVKVQHYKQRPTPQAVFVDRVRGYHVTCHKWSGDDGDST